MPHLVAQALAGLAADGGLQAALAGTAFRDMTRVARADAGAVDGDPGRQPRRLRSPRSTSWSRASASCAPRSATSEATRTEWALGLEWLDAVDAARWREPDWREEPVDGWAGLLEHGRAGRAVRRLRRTPTGDAAREVAR